MLALVTGAIARGVRRPAGDVGWIGQPTDRVSQTDIIEMARPFGVSQPLLQPMMFV
jgi:hypothetical protein